MQEAEIGQTTFALCRATQEECQILKVTILKTLFSLLQNKLASLSLSCML
jgi:hypothetical protein